MSTLVSIVIAAYNNWPDLELAIQSALCQSHEPVEVIVVDNSSTDGTPIEVPRLFGDRISYIRQPNTGDAGAYNTGMKLAKGKFVQFMDGDDFLTPMKIEKQVEVLESEPDVDLLSNNLRCFQTLSGAPSWVDGDIAEDELSFQGFLSGSAIGTGVGVIFRATALERIGAFDESLYIADADYELRAHLAKCRFRHLPGPPIAFKRVRPGQMSASVPLMLAGSVALWTKALGLVTCEPYRSMVRFNLGRHRFWLAVRAEGMTVRDALAEAKEARKTSPEAVPLLAFLAGIALIVVPGAPFLARSPKVRKIRRMIARSLGFKCDAP
jgi:glycosyltransferase involved in cell wall biosynthesis